MVGIVYMCEHNIYQNKKWRVISRSAAFLRVKLSVIELYFKYKTLSNHLFLTLHNQQNALFGG